MNTKALVNAVLGYLASVALRINGEHFVKIRQHPLGLPRQIVLIRFGGMTRDDKTGGFDAHAQRAMLIVGFPAHIKHRIVTVVAGD